jgi:hypothetical protein
MSAPTLLEIQRRMQAFVLHGEDEISSSVEGGVIADKERRLRIYADAYRLRLVEVLGNDFPVLKACIGESIFDTWATEYLAAHPSRYVSVRHVGNAFSDWLNSQSKAGVAAAELAAFEWAQGEAFDSADADVVVLGDVAGIAPEAWSALKLQVHPATRWLSLRSNAPACVVAHDNDRPFPDAIVSDQPAEWLLWRRGMSVHWRSLPADEAAALAAVRAGANFGEICEFLRPWHEEELLALRAASLLKLWISDELIAALEIG